MSDPSDRNAEVPAEGPGTARARRPAPNPEEYEQPESAGAGRVDHAPAYALYDSPIAGTAA
jgi:hypothetical protein